MNTVYGQIKRFTYDIRVFIPRKKAWLSKFGDCNSYKLLLKIYNVYIHAKYNAPHLGKNRFVHTGFSRTNFLIPKMPTNFAKYTL